MNTVSFVGLGYIGLPTALVAAQYGFKVHGFDVDTKKISSINAGISPIAEPGIQELLQKSLRTKTFCAHTNLQPADFFIIAVPTPFKENKKADCSYVFQAAKSIVPILQKGNCVILESTVPVGTTQQLAQYLSDYSGLQAGKDFYVAHCPERVLPGKILQELISNDRIIGGINAESSQRAKTFYSAFVQGICHITNDKTAEMVKLTENSFRDVQIAFANQVAAMSTAAQINPFDVIELANKHPRVKILEPGCGVGGHCIAVDPWFLIESFPHDSALLSAARTINDQKPVTITKNILDAAQCFIKKNNRTPQVLILGLTFKPNVDDVRESPALHIAQSLLKQTGTLNLAVHDPYLSSEKIRSLGFNVANTLPHALKTANIIAILVKHTPFKTIDLREIIHTIVIDPCGLYQKGNFVTQKESHEANFSRKRNCQTT